MKRSVRPLLALGAVLCSCAVGATDPATRNGYAFESPRVLAQQRLFGIAHGIGLLAAACRDVPASAQAAQDAYSAWRQRQQPAIDAAVGELSVYHFGAAVEWPALVQKLRLRETLGYAPDSAELQAACATLPQALSKPRYDLVARFRLEEFMARIVAATDIEARDHYCHDKLPDFPRELHAARYEVWREINEPAIQQASATLVSDWPEEAPAASFAEWRTELRRDTKPGGSTADCLAFSASLKSPETALRNVFLLPPPPQRTNAK